MNESWPNAEVLPAETNDTELPDALSSLTICIVGKCSFPTHLKWFFASLLRKIASQFILMISQIQFEFKCRIYFIFMIFIDATQDQF